MGYQKLEKSLKKCQQNVLKKQEIEDDKHEDLAK